MNWNFTLENLIFDINFVKTCTFNYTNCLFYSSISRGCLIWDFHSDQIWANWKSASYFDKLMVASVDFRQTHSWNSLPSAPLRGADGSYNSTRVSVENRPRVWNCGSFTSTWFSSMNLSHCRLDKIEWKSVSIYRSRSSTRAPCLYLLGHKKPLSDLIFRNPIITKIERIKKMKAKACLKFHDKLNATKHMMFKTSYL